MDEVKTMRDEVQAHASSITVQSAKIRDHASMIARQSWAQTEVTGSAAVPFSPSTKTVGSGISIPAQLGIFVGSVHDDSRKGVFGGQSIRDGWKIVASVTADDNSDDWFEVKLLVEWMPNENVSSRDKEPVVLFFHDTFRPDRDTVRMKGNQAEYTLYAYEAFTVGVLAGKDEVPLELDLNMIPNLPQDFAYS